MRNAKSLTIVIIALVTLLCHSSKAHAEDVGTAWTYQGRLIDGEQAADRAHDFQFKLFDSIEDGNQLGSDVNIPGVDVIEGYFTVQLDFGRGIFNGEARWLQIGVRPGDPNDTNSYTVLDPRQEMTPAPYAIYAENATGVTIPLILSGSRPYPILNVTNSGTGYSISAIAAGMNSRGVYGYASGLGNNFGGYFVADGGMGRGVLGEANADNGVGVRGKTGGSNGRGVYGSATNTDNVINYGGYFEADGEQGRGVYGIANYTGMVGPWEENYGGYFESLASDGHGVLGMANGDYGKGVGGKTSGSNGKAVYGSATNDEGSSENYGGYFEAKGGNGVGVYAEASGTTAHGIHAIANGNYAIAIRADSENGTAILANGKVTVKGNIVIRSETDGSTILELGEGLDYAEGFDVTINSEIKPGSVLVIDPANPGKLMLSHSPYDTKVAGIVAGANGLGSGVKLGSENFDHDVALAGRVYCNVDASQTGIEPGDLLTTSTTPGFAMKVTDETRAQGAILGKSMEKLEKGQIGQILVLVTLQ